MERNKPYTREDLIKCCLYYNGEKECPFSDYWDSVFWQQESFFIHKFETGFFGNQDKEAAIRDYMSEFFMHLADLHDTMDDGKLYKERYLKVVKSA